MNNLDPLFLFLQVSEYTGSVFFCFDGFAGSSQGDCLLTPSSGVGSVSLSLSQDQVNGSSPQYPSALGVQGNAPCSVQFNIVDVNNTSMVSVSMCNGFKVELNTKSTFFHYYTVYMVSSSLVLFDDFLIQLKYFLLFPPRCRCLLSQWCSVTGFSIIDISGVLTSIPDRCGYSLLSRGDGGLQLEAVFRDRRRRDVSLLDHLLLTVGSTHIHIGQGGVKVRQVKCVTSFKYKILGALFQSNPLDLWRKFYKHDSSQINFSSGLFVVLVHLFSHKYYIFVTLCPFLSCNLLNSTAFAMCHAHIDPTPFINSCNRTLCIYPSVDGLQCSFHQTYETLCSRANVTLSNWETEAHGLCLDTYCSENEFCGVDLNEEMCLCRAVFVEKYKSNKTLGEPTVCGENSASVYLIGCLLNEKRVKYSELHLNDPNCKGQLDPQTHLIKFGFDNINFCSTEVTTENSQMIFKNTIRMKNQTGMVTRQDQFTVDFSCYYIQPEIKTVALRIRDSSVVQTIVSGVWSYNLTMKAYLDWSRTLPILPETILHLDQTVWVQLNTSGLDYTLVSVVTESCWATRNPQPNSTPRYDLVIHGCANPKDHTVKVEANGRNTSNFFSFNMFQFKESSDMFLHCEVKLCTHKSSCVPVNSDMLTWPRRGRRRSVYDDPNPAVITMSWSN
uniref:ZP domain-containing protein n=1 Tax=Periophthalmus magnuspinnatus TaxID=409849 RepID=A0A3B4A8N4_9GOBI